MIISGVKMYNPDEPEQASADDARHEIALITSLLARKSKVGPEGALYFWTKK